MGCLETFHTTGESLFTFFASLAYAFYSLYQPIKINSECQKNITISVVCENLSLIYQILLEKFSFKNSKFSKECMGY